MSSHRPPLCRVSEYSVPLWLLVGAAVMAADRTAEKADPDSHPSADQRFVLRFSESALNRLWGGQIIDQQVKVRDLILGTSVYGQARVIGTPRVQLVPSNDQAAFRVLIQGRAYSQTTGYNGPAILYSRTVTDFTAIKPIAVEAGNGFRADPTQIWAGTQLYVDGIDSTRGGLVGRMVRRRAERIEASQHGEATEIARQRAAGRIAAAVERTSQDRLARLNWIAPLRGLASTFFWVAGQDAKPTYALSTTSQYLQIGVSFRGRQSSIAASSVPSPVHPNGAPMELWIHESILGGQTDSAIDVLSPPARISNLLMAVSATAKAIARRWYPGGAVKQLVTEQPIQIGSAGDWRVIAIGLERGQQRSQSIAAARPIAEPPRQPPVRTWNSGLYHANATFLALEGNIVRLQRTTGVRTSIPLEKLSAKDQQWISEYLADNWGP